MKRYERPEMNCELFLTEDVITTSGAGATPTPGSQYTSSLNLLKGEIAADGALSGLAASEGSWIYN